MKTSRVMKKKSPSPKMKVTLPQALNDPPDDFLSYVTLIYGESSIGKTSLLSKFPDSITLMLEPKRRGLRMRMYEVRYVPRSKMKKDAPTPWDEIKAFVDACLEDDSVTTICIDNVDRAYELCQNHICFEKGVKHPSDVNDFGATWNQVREEFARVFDQVIYDESKSLVFTSKFQRKDFEDAEGDTNDRVQPSFSRQCMKYMMDCTDFVFFYTKRKGKRCFIVRSDPAEIFTKIGPEERFLDQNGEPIEVLEAGETAQAAFDSLLEGFANNRTDMLRKAETVSAKKKSMVKKVK